MNQSISVFWALQLLRFSTNFFIEEGLTSIFNGSYFCCIWGGELKKGNAQLNHWNTWVSISFQFKGCFPREFQVSWRNPDYADRVITAFLHRIICLSLNCLDSWRQQVCFLMKKSGHNLQWQNVYKPFHINKVNATQFNTKSCKTQSHDDILILVGTLVIFLMKDVFVFEVHLLDLLLGTLRELTKLLLPTHTSLSWKKDFKKRKW